MTPTAGPWFGAPAPGEELPPQEFVLTAEDLRRYADASGDHNPIHLDDRVAREFGLKDGIIAHGMLVMGRLAAYVSAAAGAEAPASLAVRFRAPVRPGVAMVLTGRVVSVEGAQVVVEAAVAPRAGGAPAVTATWVGQWRVAAAAT